CRTTITNHAVELDIAGLSAIPVEPGPARGHRAGVIMSMPIMRGIILPRITTIEPAEEKLVPIPRCTDKAMLGRDPVIVQDKWLAPCLPAIRGEGNQDIVIVFSIRAFLQPVR